MKASPATLCLFLVAASAALPAADTAVAVPDISGAWEQIRDPAAPQAPQAQLKPDALKQRQALTQAIADANARGEPLATATQRCMGDGMPGMMGGPFPVEILQSRGQVTIIQEGYTQVRRIFLGKPQKQPDEVEPGFFGRSVGRWEGGALLVDTVGIKEGAMYRNARYSAQLRVREKIYLAPDGNLRDEITLDDPLVLEKPYTYTISYRRLPDYEVLEYVCEDNRYYTDESGAQRLRPDSPGR